MKHTFENGYTVHTIAEKTLLSILKETTPYNQWHPSILSLKEKHPELKLNTHISNKLIESPKFQILNFLLTHNDTAFSRHNLLAIESHLVTGTKSGDIIQVVNKTDQNGLKRFSFKHGNITYYSIPEAIFTNKFLQKRKNYISKDEARNDEQRIRSFFTDLAKDDYELGHKDPRLALTLDNMVMQPSQINRSYKDNYIFDENGLPKCPNPERFISNPDKFYNEEDQKLIFLALKHKFDLLQEK